MQDYIRKTFSIIVPVYQNESNILETVTKLLDLTGKLPGYRLEYIFVDDGSTDKSHELLYEYHKKYPDVIQVVRLSRNFGQTPAVQAGMHHATGDVVGVISADLQEPHEKFIDMIKAWESGAKFVIGERVTRDENRVFAAISGVYWWLIRRFAFPDFPRMGYDFFICDRQIVDELNKINEKNSSIYCLVYWLGFPAVRMPVHRKLREKGKSQWHFASKIKFTIDTLISFTRLPSRIITYIGFTLGASCLLYFFYAFTLWLMYRATPPGWMTVIGIITFLGAITLFALGIISEYLLRILQELKQRPPFVIDSINSENTSNKRIENNLNDK